jgi:hypothetical protein
MKTGNFSWPVSGGADDFFATTDPDFAMDEVLDMSVRLC